MDAIEQYRRGQLRPLDRVKVIGEIGTHLASSSPGLSEDEVNDALKTYFEIINQHDWDPVEAGSGPAPPGPAVQPKGSFEQAGTGTNLPDRS